MTVEQSWFRKDKDESGKAVSDIVKHYWEIEGRQRREIANLSLALFTGNMKYSMSGGGSILSVVDALLQDPAAYNLIQASIGTLVANLYSNRVRPLFVTEGGNYELREKAKGMQQAVEGEFYEQEIYGQLGLAVCIYGLMFEGGGVEWYPDIANERIVSTMIQPWDYFIPKREARVLKLRQVFNRTSVDRGELLAYYSEADKDIIQRIEDAPPARHDEVDNDDSYRDGSIADRVTVSKAWHLPSGRVDINTEKAWGRGKDGRPVDPGHDGRHVCTLEDGFVLSDAPWPMDFFPQSWFLPNYVPGQAWSRGLPEVLAPVQLSINRWNERTDRIMDRHARPLLVTWKNAKISPSRITNELASILESAVPVAQAIQYLQSPGVPPELFTRIQQLRSDGRDQIGLSDLTMQAERPQGITSAPPLRHLKNEQSQRLTAEYRAWERFHLHAARSVVWCHRMLAQECENHEAVFADSKELNRIPWETINLPDERFRLKTYPTNLFATDPEARLAQQIDLVNAGLITKEQGLANTDNPDTDALLGDTLAPEKNIERRLDAIIKASEYTSALMPTPYMDLDLAKRLVVRRLNRIEADGESQDKLDRLIAFEKDIDYVAALKASQLAAAAQNAAQVTQQSANPGLAAPNAAPPQPPPPPGPGPGGPPPMPPGPPGGQPIGQA